MEITMTKSLHVVISTNKNSSKRDLFPGHDPDHEIRRDEPYILKNARFATLYAQFVGDVLYI